jgi:hypothetical protein
MTVLAVVSWFHWQDGWYFGRVKESGDVAIRHEAKIILIPKAEWASIVAEVSRHGGTAVEYQRAVELHG